MQVLLTVAGIVAIGVLLASLIKIVRTCTTAINGVISELRQERQLLNLQKQILSEINAQISLQKMMMDQQLTLAMNSIQSMKMLHEREKDPKWMEKFEAGRDNAQYN